MSFEVITTHRFEKSAKPLIKKYNSMKADLKELFESLAENPGQGIELAPGIRKIRMAITSKGRGKSGGSRVITYNIFTNEKSGKVYLIDIYDKADTSSVDVSVIKSILSDMDFE